MAGVQRFGEIDENRARVALELEECLTEKNFVDIQGIDQIKLNTRVVLEHLEADRVLAADELLFGIDADIEVVIKQIVVGTIRPISTAQNIGVRRLGVAMNAMRGGWLLRVRGRDLSKYAREGADEEKRSGKDLLVESAGDFGSRQFVSRL